MNAELAFVKYRDFVKEMIKQTFYLNSGSVSLTILMMMMTFTKSQAPG